MYLPHIALVSLLSGQSPDALPPATVRYPDSTTVADTLTAVELQLVPYFIVDSSGESRAYLDSCYTFFRGLLATALQRGWSGDFTFDELAKRYPSLHGYSRFHPVLFRILGKAVYAFHPENPGFTPTIGIVNSKTEGRLTFFYATSKGESQAWALPLDTQG
ncbi:MAG: hypothetical protein AAB445_02120 [Patescibacteria group bacterium]